MTFIAKMLIMALVATACHCSHAETAMVGVASNFIQPMRLLQKDFERRTGHTLVLSFASSGKLYTQIKYGAPFDVFLSADQSKPEKLIEEQFANKHSQFTYAIGTLVLWSTSPGLLERSSSTTAMAQFLHSNKYNKLAIANPRLAPYGAAAQEVIKNMKVAQNIQTRIVQGENIARAMQYVRSGNAQIGFVALSQIPEATIEKTASLWLVPYSLYTPIKQDAILLKHGQKNIAAAAFINYLKQENTQKIIQQQGYRRALNEPEANKSPPLFELQTTKGHF